jgi:RNA polymerase sigma-70 factor (ECF subfamily)
MQVGYVLPGISAGYGERAAAETSDGSLIAAITDGDKHALKLLFTRHNVRVYRFALRFTGNSSTAEDIVNEVFLDVWRKAAGFEGKSQVTTWLLAIARNKAFSISRRSSEEQLDDGFASTIADSADNPEESTDKNGCCSILQLCLTRLSAAHREVIDLVYYHEKSVAEVSAIVGVPETTVKTRMFYARKRLAELLGANGIYTACS